MQHLICEQNLITTITHTHSPTHSHPPTHPHTHTHSLTHSHTHTALSDTQFIAPSGGSIDVTATFPAGTSSFDITFPINDDNVALEAVEELIATLSLNNAPTGVELGTPSVTVIRIQDDDGECDHGCMCVGVLTLFLTT